MRSGAGVRSATVLVGREVEFDILSRALRAASNGQPSCTLLAGEGGMGKSRLIGEVTTAARQLRLAVAAARAPISAPAPFSLMAEALRSRLRGHPLPPTGSPFDLGLRLILPEWDAPAGQADQLDASQLRLLAIEGLVRVLRDVAAAGPGALLVLDDLHAADADSLEAVRYVASAGINGLAVVAAMRPGESAVADDLVRAVRGDRATAVVSLEPLPPRAVGDLISNLLGAAPPAELVADVISRTDGVPLLVEEVVDAHIRAGTVLVEGGSASWRGGPAVIPGSVRGMVQARLDRVPEPLRPVLIALAVAGPPEPTDLIAAVACADQDTVAEALRHGIDVGLLTTSGGAIGFRHNIIRDAVLDAAVPQLVNEMHRRAADALTDAQAGARRAEHLAAAGELDGAAATFASAALRGLDSHALLSAERLARRALELARSPETKARAADALATVLVAQGRWADALDIDDATVSENGDTAERLDRMAAAALDAGHPDRARSVLARQERLRPATRLLAGRVALVAGEVRTALAEADAVLTESVDIDTRLTALDLKARCLDFIDDRDGARLAWEAQASEAASSGRTQARLRAVFQLGKQEFFTGRRPGSLREAVAIAAESGALVELAWAEETLAIALTLQGDPVAALDVLAVAVPRARELRLDQLGFLLVAQAGAQNYLGEPTDELLAEAEAVAPAPDLLMFTGAIRAIIAMQHGRYEEAVARLTDVCDLVAAMPGVAPIDAPCLLIWALAATGRMDAAREALMKAEALPDLARWYPRPIVTRAGRALLAGDADGVDAAIASAAGPMPFSVAIMRTVGAQVLGGAVAVKWLREALDIYEATGALGYRERSRRLLRDAGGPVPRRRQPAGAVPDALARQGVTAREAEILRLLGEGMSNADIASRLFLSVRTVETHVSSLLAKLQTRSRGQLTAISATIVYDS